jgi:hypothetical protein
MKPFVVMILGLLTTSVAVHAQGPAPAQQNAAQAQTPAAQTPRLAIGKPDLQHVPAVHSVPVEAVHGVDQSERGLGVHVGYPAR